MCIIACASEQQSKEKNSFSEHSWLTQLKKKVETKILVQREGYGNKVSYTCFPTCAG